MDLLIEIIVKATIGGIALFIVLTILWKLFIKNFLYRPTVKQVMEKQGKISKSATWTPEERVFYISVVTGDYITVMKLWRKVNK